MAIDLPLSCELKDYSVLHLWTEVKSKADDVKPVFIRPEIKVKLGTRDYKAFILCRYEISRFSFECAIEGTFRFGEDISNTNVGNAWMNACTMLYGIVRGIFSSAIAQAIHETHFLPSVMMANFINRRLEELKKASESKKADKDKSAKKRLSDPVSPKAQ